jgi:hypothetical protein
MGSGAGGGAPQKVSPLAYFSLAQQQKSTVSGNRAGGCHSAVSSNCPMCGNLDFFPQIVSCAQLGHGHVDNTEPEDPEALTRTDPALRV